MKLRWLPLSAGLIAGVVWTLSAAAETELPRAAPSDRLRAACALEAANTITARQGRYQDLEVFALAEARETRGLDQSAAQARQYLKIFFPKSVLQSLLPKIPEHTPSLELWDTDPEWSRLVREGVRLVREKAEPETWQTWYTLVMAASRRPDEMTDAQDLAEFLSRHPDAPLSGWAAYQLLWEARLAKGPAKGSGGFQGFWAGHPQHPLAQEASEALDIRWFSPERMAHLSAVFPGWGEEVLDPGLRESSRPLLSETVYLLGALGFMAAAQHQSRQGNLTGALIFINLLMQNHLGSAEQAFATAHKRNASERRKFIAERADQPIAGQGEFLLKDFLVSLPEPGAQQWGVNVGYAWQSAASAWRGSGAVHEDQLDNLKFSLEWAQRLMKIEVFPGWHAALAVAPRVQWFSTQAESSAEADLAYEVADTEWGGALQAAGTLGWEGEGPWMQLRVCFGPGYRQRRLTGAGAEYWDQGNAWFGSASLQFGGTSGVFWQAGVSADDNFRPGVINLPDRVLNVPSRSLEIQFGLGAYY